MLSFCLYLHMSSLPTLQFKTVAAGVKEEIFIKSKLKQMLDSKSHFWKQRDKRPFAGLIKINQK